MPKDNDLLELDDGLDLNKLKGIEKKFNHLLRENDLLYKDKISFNISYNPVGNYYKIKITSAKGDFNSQEYFKNNFEMGLGRKKLGEFIIENNIGFISC